MKVLWVATKAPWPPVDGGRLLLHNTLRALSTAGHELTLVAPVDAEGPQRRRLADALAPLCRPLLVPSRPPSTLAAWVRAQIRREPWTVVRHRRPEVGRRVAELLARECFDVVQAEQVQALASVEAAFGGPAPVVLRAQNVESDLWHQTAARSAWRGPLLRLEARRLAAWEGRAVRRAAATVALTAEDRTRLAELAGDRARVERLAAPFDGELPAAPALPGAPAIVLFGSGGWSPNAGGCRWFLRRAWPRLRVALPGAELHLFGLGAAAPAPAVTLHPSPDDSRAAFAAGSVLVVPLEVASGVRMKILEAWARGIPVVATPAAARGLGATSGEHLLVAESAVELADAVARYHREPALVAAVVAAARARLCAEHGLAAQARRLEALYASLSTEAGGGNTAPSASSA